MRDLPVLSKFVTTVINHGDTKDPYPYLSGCYIWQDTCNFPVRMDKEKKNSENLALRRADVQISSYLDEQRTTALRYFSEDVHSASRDIARIDMASKLLHMSDLQFFELSYEECFEEPLSHHDLMSVYTDYQLNSTVPEWARDYASHVLAYYYHGVTGERDFSLN